MNQQGHTVLKVNKQTILSNKIFLSVAFCHHARYSLQIKVMPKPCGWGFI
jgi:hypothetical protein